MENYQKNENEERSGKKQYHLMRLQFGQNMGKIKWSVNRNYNENNYKNNDTDISFVVEY